MVDGVGAGRVGTCTEGGREGGREGGWGRWIYLGHDDVMMMMRATDSNRFCLALDVWLCVWLEACVCGWEGVISRSKQTSNLLYFLVLCLRRASGRGSSASLPLAFAIWYATGVPRREAGGEVKSKG